MAILGNKLLSSGSLLSAKPATQLGSTLVSSTSPAKTAILGTAATAPKPSIAVPQSTVNAGSVLSASSPASQAISAIQPKPYSPTGPKFDWIGGQPTNKGIIGANLIDPDQPIKPYIDRHQALVSSLKNSPNFFKTPDPILPGPMYARPATGPNPAEAAKAVPETPAPTPAPAPAPAPVVPTPAPPPPPAPPQIQYVPQYIPVPIMPQLPSLTQAAVGRGRAQELSNYIQALRLVGADGNNRVMNAPGQMGQEAVAGFTGFQNQGIPTQLGGQFVGPTDMQNAARFGWQDNRASMTPMGSVANAAYMPTVGWAGNYATGPGMQFAGAPRLAQPGGISMVNAPGLLSGAGNAPQWMTPAPWGNPQNAPPDTQGSNWGSGSKAWENYFNADSPNAQAPGQVNQPGAFYSGRAPGAPIYDNQGRPIPGTQSVSDQSAKQKIEYAEPELQDFLNQLGAYSYEYKNPEHGANRYISPMAQEMEKSKLGKNMVFTDPRSGYKMVDYGQLDHGRLKGVELAALAMLNKKVNSMSKQIKNSIVSELKNKKKRK